MLSVTLLRLVLGVFLSLSAPALAAPVLTLFCTNHTFGESSNLAVLPSNVQGSYFTPNVKFTDEKNQPFKAIFDYQPYSGDDLKVQLFIRAQPQSGPINIYRSLAHIGRRLAASQWIATSRSLSPELLGNLEQRGLGKSLMAQKGDLFIFAGAAEDEFLIYDLTSQTSRSVHLQAGLVNPRFSMTGNFLIFDLYNKKSFRWQQVAYDLTTFKISFQTPASILDASSLEFNPSRKNWVWLELEHQTKGAALVESSGVTKTVLTKMNASLSLPFVYSPGPTGLDIYWTEHAYQRETSSGGTAKNVFSQAQAQKLSLDAGSAQEFSWPYPDSLLARLSDLVPEHLMSGGFKGPQSDELYFSLDRLGGLISLNTITGKWALIANTYPCIEPRWTLQGPTK